MWYNINIKTEAYLCFFKGFERESLICIAFLVGSDYSEGVETVGIVRAVEILQEFEGSGFEKLKNFK